MQINCTKLIRIVQKTDKSWVPILFVALNSQNSGHHWTMDRWPPHSAPQIQCVILASELFRSSRCIVILCCDQTERFIRIVLNWNVVISLKQVSKRSQNWLEHSITHYTRQQHVYWVPKCSWYWFRGFDLMSCVSSKAAEKWWCLSRLSTTTPTKLIKFE